MTTTPAMDAALSAPVVVDFMALEIVLPFATLRFVTGAAPVTFTVPDPLNPAAPPVVATFLPENDTYGTVTGLGGTTEGIGTSSPRLRFIINPPTLAAAAQLNLPTNQGWPCRLWYGLVDPVTGVVVPDPILEFVGVLDQPRYAGGVKRASAVEYDVASAMEALFSAEEGQRLNHEQHTRSFPGELGLEYVSEIERQLPWNNENIARSPMIGAGGATGGGPPPVTPRWTGPITGRTW